MAGRTSLVGLSLLVIAALAAVGAPPKDRETPRSPRERESEPEKPQSRPPPPPSEQEPALSWKTAFQIKPRTPAKDLLPAAPKARKAAPVYLGDDLSKVPELVFEAPPAKKLATKEWTKRTGHN